MFKRSSVGVTCGLALLGACAHQPYVWVDDVPADAPEPDTYFIRPGDQLQILVWNQPQLSGPTRVRRDGNTTIALIGDVALGGLTTTDAAAQIARRLNGLVVDPNVTVVLQEGETAAVTVVGEVRTPGTFPLQRGDRVLTLLARAGGPTEFADYSEIYVVRREANLRVRFRYRDLKDGRGKGLDFELRDGDIIVVE